MLSHFLQHVLRESPVGGLYRLARFWSARSATATTCFAGVAFVGFIFVSNIDISFRTYAWGFIWTSLLICSLLLMNDRHQMKTAWVSSAAIAFLFAVMFMHQMLPAYSRAQSLFGPGSPITAPLAADPAIRVATVANEFSEVPFYLKRSDVQNFPLINDSQLKRFIGEQKSTLLVVDYRLSSEQLKEQLPAGTVIKRVSRKGQAIIAYVVPGNATTRTAGTEPATDLK